MSNKFEVTIHENASISSSAVEPQIKNSNMSLHAKTKYCKGATIMEDRPITFIKCDGPLESVNLQDMYMCWVTKLLECRSNNISQILNLLHPRDNNRLDAVAIYKKIKLNMFDSVERGYHLFGLFSFINHSCAANSIIVQLDDMKFILVALTDVDEGQEITVDYLGLVFENRQQELQYRYNFLCTCGSCSEPIFRSKFLLKTNVCWNCSAKSPKFRCSKCKVSGYCSVECQKINWPLHKIACSTICKVLTYDPLDKDIISGVDIEKYKLKL